MTLKLAIRGLQGLGKKAKRQERRVISNVGEGLIAGAQIILDDARERVPVRTGELRDSGRVDPLEESRGELRTGVSFGGVRDVDYAVDVHEDPDQPDRKYLEIAEKKNRGAVKEAIASKSKG